MRPIQHLPSAELFARRAEFDAIIDVRSPGEFAEDAVPGALNLFALSNEERAEVGTLYKQVNPFEARKVGAALVCANVARHIQSQLAEKPKDFAPLLYCWRGGQRSNSFGLVLSQIGWNVTVLEGGYKAYRREVLTCLQTQPQQFSFIVLGGYTGSGKTELLTRLTEAGAQCLDLEGLAGHRGSLLGEDPAVTPATQKQFDSRLVTALQALDPTKPVFVESESAKIGRVYQPGPLWTALSDAPYVQLETELAQRAAFSLSRYPSWTGEPAELIALLERMRRRHGGETVARWQAAVAAGDWLPLIKDLLARHYDPAYAQSRHKHFRPACVEIPHDPLNATKVAATVQKLLSFSKQLGLKQAG